MSNSISSEVESDGSGAKGTPVGCLISAWEDVCESLPDEGEAAEEPIRNAEGISVLVPSSVQWVVKVSKHCNLRCTYCYEYPSLADKTRIAVDDATRMFGHIAEAFEGTGRQMDFVWHGGEPLLIEPEYFHRVFDAQKRIFDEREVSYTNYIQTNLTVLDAPRIDLLREHFTAVGVSLDVFGGERCNKDGIADEKRVIANLHRLRDAEVEFGCITVLHRDTAPRAAEIHDFFADLGCTYRLLPIYRRTHTLAGHSVALTEDQIVDALGRTFDRWLERGGTIRVRPIHEYLHHVLRAHATRESPGIYDKSAAESLFIVDVDGRVYSTADVYDPERAGDSLFARPLSDCIATAGYRRAVRESRERTQAHCARCPWFGSCSGYFAAEATPDERSRRKDPFCGVAKRMHDYIDARIATTGLPEHLGARWLPADPATPRIRRN